MNVLVINSGSSSIKYQLIDMEREVPLCSGLVERIGEPMGKLTHKIRPDAEGEEKLTFEQPFTNHVEGMKRVVELITDADKGVIKDKSEIGAIGHRVLLGGEEIKQSVRIDDWAKGVIRDYIPLGPLHNPANLAGIEVAEELFPGLPNVGVFDTEFHQSMPASASYEVATIFDLGSTATWNSLIMEARRSSSLLELTTQVPVSAMPMVTWVKPMSMPARCLRRPSRTQAMPRSSQSFAKASYSLSLRLGAAMIFFCFISQRASALSESFSSQPEMSNWQASFFSQMSRA